LYDDPKGNQPSLQVKASAPRSGTSTKAAEIQGTLANGDKLRNKIISSPREEKNDVQVVLEGKDCSDGPQSNIFQILFRFCSCCQLKFSMLA